LKIAVVLGGSSSEKDISILTGLSVAEALSGKYDTEVIHIGGDISILPEKLLGANIVFNALHGGIGENGDIQSFFDLHHISYCGSAAKASRLAMDKHLSKMIAKTESVPTPEWILIKSDNYSTQLLNENAIKFDFPYIVKPADEGSTVGLSLVNGEDEIEGAIEIAGKHSTNILLEEYISGRELTVGILGAKALPIVEIISEHELYDYECKYAKGKSQYKVPAELPEKVARKIQDDALRIYKAIGCRHYGRIDFRLNEKNEHYFLEINTLPGMTSTSLLPMAAQAAGLDFPELVDTIIKIAMVDQ
jgi:D-alanine-D-alanine ligase